MPHALSLLLSAWLLTAPHHHPAPPDWAPLLPNATLWLAWTPPQHTDPYALQHALQWGLLLSWDLASLWAPTPSPPATEDIAYETISALEAREPDVAQTRAAALRHAGLLDAGEDRWTSRARLSALAPSLWELQTTWQQQQDSNLTTRDDLDRVTDQLDTRLTDHQGQEDTLRLSMQLRWELRGLIYSPDELNISRERARLADQRRALEEEVTRLYFARRRLQAAARLAPPSDWAQAADLRLQERELTDRLDLLTGGWFTRPNPTP